MSGMVGADKRDGHRIGNQHRQKKRGRDQESQTRSLQTVAV